MPKSVKEKYAGYALQKVIETERRARAEVQRLKDAGRSEADIERAEARADSWTNLVKTCIKAQKNS